MGGGGGEGGGGVVVVVVVGRGDCGAAAYVIYFCFWS